VLLARKIAELEGTESAVGLASGMAATAMTLLALAGPGDHVAASMHLYGATRELIDRELPRRGVSTSLVDPERPGSWEEAVRPNTRALFLEVPTNPTMRVFDPRPLAGLAREVGARVVVDSTFASPVNLRPAAHGADVVIHSATKYLGGHSDLIAGVVAGPSAVIDEVTRLLKLYGPALDPHVAWLLERGIRTLHVRVTRQNENALGLARWLEEHPAVERVFHPGLPGHPDHALAEELLDGFGGMVAFVARGGGPAADRILAGLRLAKVAPSLGGVETLVSQPRFTSHAGLDRDARARAGIPDGFVRVSVGIEDLDDLIGDFSRALSER
jgi:cystathionine beta-lyase/cystathionine gamma-synthase